MSKARVVEACTWPEQRRVERSQAERRSAPDRRRAAAARAVDRGERDAGAEDRPRWKRLIPRTAVDAPGEVAQGDRRAGDEPADEAAAGLVVPGEQQVQRADEHGVEQQPASCSRNGSRRQSARLRAPPASCRRDLRGGDAAPPAAPGAGQGDRADRRGASTVISPSVSKPAEVDEDHVDDVAAVALGQRLARSSRRTPAASVRDRGATMAKTNTTTPRRRPRSTTRTTAAPAPEVRSKRSGRRRRTSTNSTVDSVSIAAWVSARSGAPCDHEQPGHRVAGDAEEQRRGEAPAGERRRRARRRAGRRPPRAGRCCRRSPASPATSVPRDEHDARAPRRR